jgi:hypothetical protein
MEKTIRPENFRRTGTPEWRKLRAMIFRRDKYICSSCGSRNTKLELDHIVPIAISKSDEHDNLQTLCKDCHSRKTGKDMWRIYKWRKKKMIYRGLTYIINNPRDRRYSLSPFQMIQIQASRILFSARIISFPSHPNISDCHNVVFNRK